MPIEDWEKMSRHTNNAEINHRRSYAFLGKKIPTLTYIQKNIILDYDLISKDTVFNQYKGSLSYTPSSIEARLQ